MTADLFDDPFSDPGGELQRDQWKRPIILRPWEPDGPCQAAAGKSWNCHIGKAHGHYTRSSTFASTLDDGPGLGIWMKRHVALAVAGEAQKDLRLVIAGMQYGEPKLDDYVEMALVRHAAHHPSLRAANMGTAIHRFTEPNIAPAVPEELVSEVQAFAMALEDAECPACGKRKGFEIVATELSVVNDIWCTAGTFDHGVRCRACSDVFCLDKKTGQEEHPIANCIQLTNYALGKGYNDRTGERYELPFPMSQKWAILAHIPLEGERCELIAYDLEDGRELCDLAAAVRAKRLREKDLRRPLETG